MNEQRNSFDLTLVIYRYTYLFVRVCVYGQIHKYFRSFADNNIKRPKAEHIVERKAIA